MATGQLERADGTTLLAAGATLIGYFGDRAIAPSIGVYRRGDSDDGIQAGLFVGRRAPVDRDMPADLPYGVRVDMQLGDEQAIVISASLDTAPLFMLLGGIIVAASSGSHRAVPRTNQVAEAAGSGRALGLDRLPLVHANEGG